MKIFWSILCGSIFLVACSKDNSLANTTDENTPTVTTSSVYSVRIVPDITYAKGLRHQQINSSTATEIPLKLDLYLPDNNSKNRPVFMFIHGGGFIGGSRKSAQIIDMANYFASRGWVFLSIDYRLRDDTGTVPQAWVDYANNLPATSVAQFLAIYPAHRDAKAALRWLISKASTYGINTDFLTVGGSSAGAVTAVTLGVSNLEDYTNELTLQQDPTLTSTHLSQSYQIQSVVEFWGTKVGVDILNEIYGHQRFDDQDPDLLIIHGTADANENTPYSSALELKNSYDASGAYSELIPLVDKGHGAWNATVNSKSLSELSFDFIVKQQQLQVQ